MHQCPVTQAAIHANLREQKEGRNHILTSWEGGNGDIGILRRELCPMTTDEMNGITLASLHTGRKIHGSSLEISNPCSSTRIRLL
jgi:hypothetical protein